MHTRLNEDFTEGENSTFHGLAFLCLEITPKCNLMCGPDRRFVGLTVYPVLVTPVSVFLKTFSEVIL
jgi:hypothetical protein